MASRSGSLRTWHFFRRMRLLFSSTWRGLGMIRPGIVSGVLGLLILCCQREGGSAAVMTAKRRCMWAQVATVVLLSFNRVLSPAASDPRLTRLPKKVPGHAPRLNIVGGIRQPGGRFSFCMLRFWSVAAGRSGVTQTHMFASGVITAGDCLSGPVGIRWQLRGIDRHWPIGTVLRRDARPPRQASPSQWRNLARFDQVAARAGLSYSGRAGWLRSEKQPPDYLPVFLRAGQRRQVIATSRRREPCYVPDPARSPESDTASARLYQAFCSSCGSAWALVRA